MKRIFPQTHNPIKFTFRQTREDFIVTELPLFDKPTNKGNFLYVKIQKIDLSTMEMLKILENELQCFTIGYAGLKDKYATTTQYISIPLKFAKRFEKFHHPKITVLESFRSKEKLSIGDLKGNHFFIRLKDVHEKSAKTMIEVLQDIIRDGVPNYFGYQRFGKESDSFEKARDVAQGEVQMKDKKVQKIMVHAYQSYLFNDWLAKRVELSTKIVQGKVDDLALDDVDKTLVNQQNGFFKVLPGDILYETSTKRWVNVIDLQSIKKPVKERKLFPTGLLAGKKAWRAKGLAGEIEGEFDDIMVLAQGTRREAWMYPRHIKHTFNGKENTFELSFTLPKGSYATVLLENLGNRDMTPKKFK